ncbi:MAG: hypothetical protein ASARMPREDX12_000322 [Alectoria sarmentosa]|nr:MAG: hypothetical protein ASARMPREDX12_000322 [Alectoria sarmentosa]
MEGSSQVGCQTLVAPFQALNSNAHQRGALNALVKTLTHQQVRELRLSLEEVDLHCDVIAELPLEISQMILRHLPLYQIFQARRVSFRWKQVLSSPQTMEPLLRSWFPAPIADTALHIPDGLSESSILSLKAEHIDAYRTGHAFSYMTYSWSCFLDDLSLDLVAYADGIMAWVDKTDSHSVNLLDLKTGEQRLFLPDARTRIVAIATSSSMVAALGSGRCHVWSLRAGDHYSLRLPSATLSKIIVSGESLAIVHALSAWQDSSTCVEMVTWTLKDQKTYSSSVALSPKKGQRLSTMRIILDDKGESVLLFELVHKYFQDDEPTHVRHVRTSLDGDILTREVIEIPDPKDYRFCSEDTAPKESNGHTVIWILAKPQCEENDFGELMLICYNFRENRLEVRTQVVTGLRIKDNTDCCLLFWKDVGYFLEYEKGRPCLKVIDLQDSTCSEAKMDLSADTQKLVLRRQEEYDPEILPFGDETFLVFVSTQGFRVWCFDANVQMFNEDIAYKKERRSNMERRLKLISNS